MSGSKSKIKGSSYERELANFMSKLYGESFIRAPFSGAYVGGTNSYRKNILSENQSKSYKGDIIPPDSWVNFNAEAKSYSEFPFHLVLTGECKQLNKWIAQLLDVADSDDINILFMKINRKGQYVCVQSKYTWVADQFLYYSSKTHGDWLIVEFDLFWKFNKDLLKSYSINSTNNTKPNTIDISTDNILPTTITV